MADAHETMIKLDGVKKIFYTDEVETHALSDIHLEIRKGEYVAISGPSGCGKSTLLSLIGLLDSPTEGDHWIKGKSVAKLSVAEPYRELGSADRKKRVQEALERVSMAHRMKHYPAQLSGGQQQRVAVARALAGSPAILLADEPTGNLDSRNSEAVMELLRNFHRDGATICMVTHDERYAHHAVRTVHLFDGRIVDQTAGLVAEA